MYPWVPLFRLLNSKYATEQYNWFWPFCSDFLWPFWFVGLIRIVPNISKNINLKAVEVVF